MLTESKCVKQTSNEREVKLTEVKGGGVGWGSTPLPYDWYLGISYVNRVKRVKQTINEPEVKLTEVNGVGWGSAPLPYDSYVGRWYVNKVKCVKQTISKREVKSTEDNWMISILILLKVNKILCHLLYQSFEKKECVTLQNKKRGYSSQANFTQTLTLKYLFRTFQQNKNHSCDCKQSK